MTTRFLRKTGLIRLWHDGRLGDPGGRSDTCIISALAYHLLTCSPAHLLTWVHELRSLIGFAI